MTDILTLTGLVATTPRHITTSEGLSITSFRLASTQRRYDRNAAKWVDAETNWFTVTCFRQLADNAVLSIMKGQRVLVTGRLRIRDWATSEKAGTNVEIDADALGHDLSWGTTVFTRSLAAAVASADAAAAASATEGASDRAAVLDDDLGDGVDDEADEDAPAAPVRALEASLPF